MLSLEQRARLAALEGLIPDAVGLMLAELASKVLATQAIVEIGSYKGKSTCYLAAGAESGLGAPVYAVDPWDTPGNIGGRFGFDTRAVRADFHAQVASMGFDNLITPLQGFSTQVAKTWPHPLGGSALQIGLLYIDGSHTEKDVRADWEAWSPYLAKGARVAFDDYDTPKNPGVKRVVDTLKAIRGSRWWLGPAPLIVGELP